ncbi:hypothetical protein [Hoyosella subflava]|uniref:Uncharacterized protein n=1 Tax=Hoyosella subflava (strain DSM 45089 / JCM 17490 / NBRC 109087 / DQS3-9A1) TaxID=443218 RepID=F6ESJ6_HOYSD|nr:hypothetical protein [Hoyosella subflava]AEF43117.1 hypothetical protein AS9A_P20073 [Hoyosella subflava DQS3-9A1]
MADTTRRQRRTPLRRRGRITAADHTASAHAEKKISAVTRFVDNVEQRRVAGQHTPQPRPAEDITRQLTHQQRAAAQALAAAAAARHLHGSETEEARDYAAIAAENERRLAEEHERAHQHAQAEQQRERNDRIIFEAAAALAAVYTASKLIPHTSHELDEQARAAFTDATPTAPSSAASNGVSLTTAALAGAALHHTRQTMGQVAGDDHVEPPMTDGANPGQIPHDIIDALTAAQLGHPRTPAEMLNKQPEQHAEAGPTADTDLDVPLSAEHGQEI